MHGFAMLSALRHGGLDQVILHHTDLLDDNDVVQALPEAGLVFSHLNPDTLLNEVGAALGGGRNSPSFIKKFQSLPFCQTFYAPLFCIKKAAFTWTWTHSP